MPARYLSTKNLKKRENNKPKIIDEELNPDADVTDEEKMQRELELRLISQNIWEEDTKII